MRVGFCGAGGTGKTALAQALATKEMPYVQSVVRSVFAKSGIRCENDQLSMTPEARFELQQVIWNEKRRLDDAHPNGYFDRTPLDHYAYMLFRCYEVMNEMDVATYQQLAQLSIRHYDVIFYCPVNTFIHLDDAVRVQSLAYAHMIDHMIRGMLNDWGLIVYELAVPHLDDRIKYINTVLQRYGAK